VKPIRLTIMWLDQPESSLTWLPQFVTTTRMFVMMGRGAYFAECALPGVIDTWYLATTDRVPKQRPRPRPGDDIPRRSHQ
jgi:hypothetical protein